MIRGGITMSMYSKYEVTSNNPERSFSKKWPVYRMSHTSTCTNIEFFSVTCCTLFFFSNETPDKQTHFSFFSLTSVLSSSYQFTCTTCTTNSSNLRESPRARSDNWKCRCPKRSPLSRSTEPSSDNSFRCKLFTITTSLCYRLSKIFQLDG